MKFQAITLLVGQLACLTTANPVSRTTTVTYQAENAQLNGVQVETKYNGYTGTGYINGFDNASESVVFTVNSSGAKTYALTIVNGGVSGTGKPAFQVNNGQAVSVTLNPGDIWTTSKGGNINLQNGSNTIKFTGMQGQLLDAIQLTG